MRIQYLRLETRHFEDQWHFYSETLGLPCRKLTTDTFEVETHDTRLIFRKNKRVQFYHFAFLLPAGSMHKALEYLESRRIDLLMLDGKKIVHFNPGMAVYFNDADDNIVEWIERPSVPESQGVKFHPSNLICVNEVGFPVRNPRNIAQKLMEEYGVIPANPDEFGDEFCWVGDARGVLIVVKKGRHWLPTERPSVYNYFEIRYRSNGHTYHLDIDRDKIKIID